MFGYTTTGLAQAPELPVLAGHLGGMAVHVHDYLIRTLKSFDTCTQPHSQNCYQIRLTIVYLVRSSSFILPFFLSPGLFSPISAVRGTSS